MTAPACGRDTGYRFAPEISSHPSGSIYGPREPRGSVLRQSIGCSYLSGL
jgi:hypothetical protein